MLTLEVPTPFGPVPARLEGEGSVGLLLAPGAGTDQDHAGVSCLRTRLAGAGLTVMTFDYAYRAAGRRSPDRAPKLMAVHRAAAELLREKVGERLVLAGRSMGGRISTMLAADDEPCAAVVAFGYPLHPAGKPDKLRVEHLGGVSVPMLMLTGTRDSLARPDLVRRHLAPLATVTLELIEGADHSFRKSGTTPDAMLDGLADRTVAWLGTIPGLGLDGPEPP